MNMPPYRLLAEQDKTPLPRPHWKEKLKNTITNNWHSIVLSIFGLGTALFIYAVIQCGIKSDVRQDAKRTYISSGKECWVLNGPAKQYPYNEMVVIKHGRRVFSNNQDISINVPDDNSQIIEAHNQEELNYIAHREGINLDICHK